MYRVTGLYYKRDAMLKSSKGEVFFLHYSESCYERLWPDHPLHDSRYSYEREKARVYYGEQFYEGPQNPLIQWPGFAARMHGRSY